MCIKVITRGLSILYILTINDKNQIPFIMLEGRELLFVLHIESIKWFSEAKERYTVLQIHDSYVTKCYFFPAMSAFKVLHFEIFLILNKCSCSNLILPL